MFGWEELAPDELRVRRIATLCAAGYAGWLLVSTDTCRHSPASSVRRARIRNG